MAEFNNKKLVAEIGKSYFNYLAVNYPVMCLDDEFYFFPRAEEAVKSLDSLDSLEKQKINQDVCYIKNLKSSLEKLKLPKTDLETKIDSIVLRQSMSSFLREFEEIKTWQKDPGLYLRIILLGINDILNKLSFIQPGSKAGLVTRIAQIPRLLNEAKSNLRKVPLGYLKTAIELADSSLDYLKSVASLEKNKSTLSREIRKSVKKSLQSLNDFKSFLKKISGCQAFIKDKRIIEAILKDSFFCKRSLKELFYIAHREYDKTIVELNETAKNINPEKTWQELLSAYTIKVKSSEELLKLYSTQVIKIRDFLKKKNIIKITETQNILVRSTPKFMKPIRASASYNSPITTEAREPAYFYITTGFTNSKTDKPRKKRLLNNIHNEYIFITAHETYPGHHLLDSIRRNLKNPIRRQIESPLFYEGWASYSEELIDESGYTKDPLQKLVKLKRRGWRAQRAMLDIGVRINKLKPKDAMNSFKDLGYHPLTAKRMVKHYLLTPGYQLCYTIGKLEIDLLRKKFASKLGLKKFHDLLLGSGQIPFYLAEEKLRESIVDSP